MFRENDGWVSLHLLEKQMRAHLRCVKVLAKIRSRWLYRLAREDDLETIVF